MERRSFVQRGWRRAAALQPAPGHWRCPAAVPRPARGHALAWPPMRSRVARGHVRAAHPAGGAPSPYPPPQATRRAGAAPHPHVRKRALPERACIASPSARPTSGCHPRAVVVGLEGRQILKRCAAARHPQTQPSHRATRLGCAGRAP